jgi:single-stranded-DNA-specific exonuclease
VDCAVTPDILTVKGIDSLSVLEPCGNGCPKPVLVMENLTIDRISLVGNGRHTRLRLRHGRHYVNAIYFSCTPEAASIQPGDVVDVAFVPQVNEYRSERTVQMNVLDIRPNCRADCSADTHGYHAIHTPCLTPAMADALLPNRATLAMVWRYLATFAGDQLQETPMCLCRKIVRWSGTPLSLGKLLTCLDIFADVGLLSLQRLHKHLSIRLTPTAGKADLSRSRTMQRLLQGKES